MNSEYALWRANRMSNHGDVKSSLLIARTRRHHRPGANLALPAREDIPKTDNSHHSHNMASRHTAGRADLQPLIIAGRADLQPHIIAGRADLQPHITAGRADLQPRIIASRADLQPHIIAGRADLIAGRADLPLHIIAGRADLQLLIIAGRADLQMPSRCPPLAFPPRPGCGRRPEAN
jgi:hypothetical protein